MRKPILTLLAVACLGQFTIAQTLNTLTKKEEKQGWKLLFDGQSTKGWHNYLKPEAGANWKVVDGSLQYDPKAPEPADLVTNGEYENYELRLEWNIAEGGNSGIIFGIHESPEFHATYQTGIEMQVLDNEKAADNKLANHLAGSLYDMKAPSAAVAKPVGEWNSVILRKKDGKLTFWLNGTQIVETQIGSEEWKQMIEKSKFKTWKGFAAYPKGHIALQSHGAVVSYRNIKIKQL